MDPDLTALEAGILWRPDISSAVLPVRAEPAGVGPLETVFQTHILRCRFTAQRASDGAQHVLFASGSCRLQLVVTGADIRDRVRLFTEAIVHPRLFERHHLLLRQLSAVAGTGDLAPRLHPADPRSARLRFVLQALDGSLAKAPQRDIAEAVLGRQRVKADWADPRGHLRDRIRRALRRGRWLMQKGYLNLLK